MPVAFVQKAQSFPATPTATVTATAGANVTGGNLIVGTATNGDTASPLVGSQIVYNGVNATIIDTDTEAGGPYCTVTFYFKNVTGGANHVTMTPTTAADPQGLEWHEVSGCDTSAPLDVHDLALRASSTSPTTSSVTTTANGEYIYSTIMDTTTGFSGISNPTGSVGTFTIRNLDTSRNVGADANSIQTTAGAITATWALSAANAYTTGIATFKAATGAVSLPPGQQSYDTPQPDRNTSYFPPQLRHWAAPDRFILIGQDTLPSGAQRHDRQPDPTDSFAQWRRWSDSSKLTLIGKDAFPPGKDIYDTPAAWLAPERFAQWRSYVDNFPLTLIGQDQLPPGKQSFDLPASALPDPFARWRSWTWSYDLNLIGQDALPPGRQTNYLPDRPDPFAWWRSWTGWYNLNLIGRDVLPPGGQTNYLPLGVSWRPDSPSQNLSNTLLTPAAPTNPPPGAQYYARPLDAQDSFAQWRSWIGTHNLNLIFQDRFPVGAILDDLPPQAPQRGIDFQPTVNIALLTQVAVPLPPGQQLYSRPIDPTDAFAYWRSWAWFSRNLAGQDQFPPGAQTNYLARGSVWQPESPQQNLFASTLQALPPGVQLYHRSIDPQDPFAQWRVWNQGYNLNLIGRDFFPPGLQLYALPPFGPPPLTPAWSNFNINLFAPPAPPPITLLLRPLMGIGL